MQSGSTELMAFNQRGVSYSAPRRTKNPFESVLQNLQTLLTKVRIVNKQDDEAIVFAQDDRPIR